nr:hypothetical protein CFP56_61158 [Quercus suber]
MLIPVNVLMTAELPLISLPFFFVPSFAIDGSTSMQVEPSASMPFQVDANEVQQHYNGNAVYDPTVDFLPERDPSGWEVPFLQGWLVGQSQAGVPSVLPLNDDGSSREPSAQYINFSILASHLSTQNVTTLGSISLPGISGRSSLQYRFSNSHFSVSDSVEGAALVNAPSDWVDTQPIFSRIRSKITTSLAAVATAELPCTVKLRILLTLPHAVLCRRFFAACVAYTLPHKEADPGYQTLIHQDPGAGTSPTQHPVSAYQVIYKLRTYSLEKLWFSACITSHKSCSGFDFYPVLAYI